MTAGPPASFRWPSRPGPLSPTRRAFLGSSLGLGAACLLPQEAPRRPLEPIRPDWSNLRGLNYIASYAPSPVAMWRHYDPECIERELAWIAALGANAVRVWLAWIVHEVEGEAHLGRLRDFAARCARHGLHLMPVLWDARFGDDYATYDAVDDWVANPGRLHVADPEFLPRADRWVEAVVEALADSPALLVWDVMNEPHGPVAYRWIRHHGEQLGRLDPGRPRTVGFALAQDNEHAADWVDVLSYHPYGIFEENRRAFTDTMRALSERHGKPFFASEAGAPRWGQPYEECLGFFEREKVGFFLFEAMVGSNRFKLVTGLVYPDGTVPSDSAVHAYQRVARQQGQKPSGEFEVKATARDFPYSGERQVAELVFGWDERTWEPKNQPFLLLGWTMISLSWAGALDDRLVEVRRLQARSKAAFDAGRDAEVEQVSSKLARIAAEALLAADFACARGLKLADKD